MARVLTMRHTLLRLALPALGLTLPLAIPALMDGSAYPGLSSVPVMQRFVLDVVAATAAFALLRRVVALGRQAAAYLFGRKRATIPD